MASFMATLPMVAALRSFRVPPKVPMAVRQAETITTSFMTPPFLFEKSPPRHQSKNGAKGVIKKEKPTICRRAMNRYENMKTILKGFELFL
jgi:hypothetical protein